MSTSNKPFIQRKANICDCDADALQLIYDSEYLSMLWSEDFELIDSNDSVLKLFDTDKETFLNSFFDFSPPFQPDGQLSAVAALTYLTKARDIGFCAFTWMHQKKTGEMFSCSISIVRQIINNKTYLITHAFGITRVAADISLEQKNYEKNQLMLKHLPIGVDFWNENFELIDCSEGTLRLFGMQSKQEYFEKFLTLSPEFQPNGQRTVDLVPINLKKVLDEGYNRFEWMHVLPNGEELPAEIILQKIQSGDEKFIISYYKDLREIKQGISNTQRAEERLKQTIDAAPYSIALWDKNFLPLDCNLATLTFFGFEDKEEFVTNYFQTLPTYEQTSGHQNSPLHDLLKQVFDEGYAYFEGEVGHFKTEEKFFVEVIFRKVLIQGEEFVVSYLNDLTYQKAMLGEIIESHRIASFARDEAEKSTRIKSEFLANMSHEIRTPMNGILGLIHLLGFTTLNEQQKEYVKKIQYSAESLLRIINDILDFSKIEAGKLEIEKTSFTLAEIKEDLFTIFSSKFSEKNIIGQIFHKNNIETKLIGDPLRLKQVLLNLIGNAIKFTNEGSVIAEVSLDVNVDTSKVMCCFCVSDTGIGLNEEQVQRLFSAFSQADTSTTRKYGGTGLGLVISKRLVEIMGGKIWVESEVGKGSKFCFTASFDLDTSVVDMDECFANIDIPSANSTANTIKTSIIAQRMPLFGYILLVEDNDINQLIANELLTAKGHKVDIAENGQQAIEMININKYDLVLMDIQMPIMDGLTASKTIRQNPKFSSLPIIAMSAHAMKGDREISINHGMNDHLAKPINPEELYTCLDSWLRKTLTT